MPWTTDDLVSAIRRQAFLPDSASLVDGEPGQYTDTELLAFADEELQLHFSALLRAQRDEQRVTSFDTAAAGVALTIDMPDRALARAVRRVHYVDSAGRESAPIAEIAPADAWSFGAELRGPSALGWYFDGDSIKVPAVPSGGWIRVYYALALPRMVAVSACARISTTSGLTATVNATPSWVSASERVDVVRGSSPFPALNTDLVVQSFTLTTITLTAWPFISKVAQPSSLTTVRADYICARETTCFPPIPQEWHSALASAVVARVLEGIGDREMLLAARATRDERIDAAVRAATPRNAGRSAAILNASSPLRQGRRWR